MERQMYVKIDWPESQPILDWKPEFHDQVYPIDNFGYMVPCELWDEFTFNPNVFIMNSRK
jgi:hypothetical protein